MENSDGDKERETLPNFARCHEQNISHEHVFDFFVTFRRAAEQQHRRGCRHDIGNADDRFLRNLARPFSGHGKNRSARKREAERNSESCPAFKIEMEQNSDTNSERGHLRHGDVDEDDSALHDMQAEINEQPWQKNAGHDRPKHYLPHDYFSAAASRETSVSISFT